MLVLLIFRTMKQKFKKILIKKHTVPKKENTQKMTTRGSNSNSLKPLFNDNAYLKFGGMLACLNKNIF